ncbi:uncharacterized protein V6R79_015929 [Siganus canaliculatus]
MNLYRSFGNLMEAWVAEGGQSSDSEWLGNNGEDPPTPSSDLETNLRSASVDSGVETASSDMSFAATSCSVSTDNTEIEAFTPERVSAGASSSQSPAPSSPLPLSASSLSPQRSLSVSRGGSAALYNKVEQALQRTDCRPLRDSKRLTGNDVFLRQRPASFQLREDVPELVRGGQRSESFDSRRMVNQSASTRISRTRPMSMIYDKKTHQASSEVLGEEVDKRLSPGLYYLEQVCQMLEEIARQQINNQALPEEKSLQEHPDMEESEVPDVCLSDLKAADEEGVSSCQRFEMTESVEPSSSKSQQQKNPHHRHFRQRSLSDTSVAMMHVGKLNADCRGQHLSTDDLLEKLNENHEEQEFKKEEMNKTNNWNFKQRFKIGSLRRVEPAVTDTKSQQMQSAEKNSARRRLSQLFRRNTRRTQPV